MRAYYSDTINDFMQNDSNTILGQLTQKHSHALEELQKNAWLKQIEILKNQLEVFKNGHLFFEFSIPRMGKRVDNVLIINDLIFVLEFKIGDTGYQKHGIAQVMDYALDLKNFHEGSHKAKLIPILISTRAPAKQNTLMSYQDSLFAPLFANENNLSEIISLCLESSSDELIDPTNWEHSIYKPTPTIIEAAQALYRGHNVQEISRSDSGTINLSRTTDYINEIIEYSKAHHKKSICFVTGVPGAGKTLAGLNIANERMKIDWACMVWGENFYFDGKRWIYQSFKGTKFQNINSEANQNYLKNSYRVLLTRARQGMIIYIPKGDVTDQTRAGKYYDGTYEYLKSLGISDVHSNNFCEAS